MRDPVDVVQSLDLKGFACPLPVAKAAQAMREVRAGDAVEILTTDPGSVPDFESWCRSTGHELLSSVERGGVYRFLIAKR